MGLQRIGSATGVNTATLPPHEAGDLIVVFAYRDGVTTPPTTPAGFTASTGNFTNSNASRVGYKVAASNAETVGTWTNATSVIAVVYRGQDTVTPIGAVLSRTGQSTVAGYDALTLQVGDGSSWVAAFAGHRNIDTALETPPAGMLFVAGVVDATDEAAAFDTNGGVSSWTSKTVNVGGSSSGWATSTIEIRVAPNVAGAAALSADSSLSASGQLVEVNPTGSASLTAAGTLTAVGNLVPDGEAEFSESGIGKVPAESRCLIVQHEERRLVPRERRVLKLEDEWRVAA